MIALPRCAAAAASVVALLTVPDAHAALPRGDRVLPRLAVAFDGAGFARVDPATLRRSGAPLRILGSGWPWAARGSLVVTALQDVPEVVIADLASRRRRTVAFGHNGPVDGVTLLPGRRALVTTGLYAVAHVVDLRTGRVLARRPLPGRVEAQQGRVVLLSPRTGIGRLRLATVGRSRIRVLAPLPARGGMVMHETARGPRGHGLSPALVVHGDTAYVASPGALLAIDLRTGRVRSTPDATAAKDMNLRSRQLVWLGHETLVLGSSRMVHDRLRGGTVALLDARTLRRRRVLVGAAAQVVRAGPRTVTLAGTRLVAFDRRGRRRWAWRVQPDAALQSHGRWVYLQTTGRTVVFDGRTGRRRATVHGDAPGF